MEKTFNGLTQHELFERRWTQLDAEFSTWSTHAQEISSYLLPRNGRFCATDRNRGDKRHNKIHDNTGTRSLRVLGAGLMAGATSPARPWFRVVTSYPELNRLYNVERWLGEVSELILRVFAKSNVYRVLHMMYEELGAFGTAAALLVEDDDGVIHLQPLTYGSFRLGTNYKGQVDTCYRTFSKTVHELVTEFGFDACSKDVQELWNNGFIDKHIEVRHVIEPRRKRNPAAGDNLNMPWKSVYYEVGREEDVFLYESGFERFPVLAPRWSTAGDDTYGHSPGMEALGDIKQLQHEQLRKAQGIDFKTMPPQLAPPEMKGQEVKWVPGGLVHVSATSPQQTIRSAFESKMELDHLLLDIQDVRERIRGSFFADLFLMLTFQNTSAQKMTATEVAERHEEKLIQLGPVLERLHTELLSPLVQLTFEALDARGMLPELPEEMIDVDLSLEFVSMLAQAQRAIGVTGIERALLIAGGVAGAKPDILDNLDEDALWTELTSMIGVPPRISRSPEARAKIRKAKLDAQAAAAQTALQEQQSKAVKNVADAQAAAPNNALRDVMSMFSGYDQPTAANY